MEEAAQYIMTYKAYENKPPTMIKERIDQDYNSILRNALTSIKGVNKTDVVTLRTTFGVCHSCMALYGPSDSWTSLLLRTSPACLVHLSSNSSNAPDSEKQKLVESKTRSTNLSSLDERLILWAVPPNPAERVKRKLLDKVTGLLHLPLKVTSLETPTSNEWLQALQHHPQPDDLLNPVIVLTGTLIWTSILRTKKLVPTLFNGIHRNRHSLH